MLGSHRPRHEPPIPSVSQRLSSVVQSFFGAYHPAVISTLRGPLLLLTHTCTGLIVHRPLVKVGHKMPEMPEDQVLKTRANSPFYSCKPLFALLSDLTEVTEPSLLKIVHTPTDLLLIVRGCDIPRRSHGQAFPSDTVSPPKAWPF